MRKITALLLSFILLISCSLTVFADDISETLSAVGLLPDFAGSDADPVTRSEFSFMVSALTGAKPEAKATRFKDVGADNIYSGAIEHLASLGVVSGTGDGQFNPKGVLNFSMASKMIVNSLGYGGFAESLGGYPKGYVDILSKLGLSKDIGLSYESILSVSDAKKLIHNVLTLEINALSYAENNGTIETVMLNEKNDSLLSKNFGVSVYEADVFKINDSGEYASVSITKNKYDSNPVKYDVGETVSLKVAEGIAIKSYLNVPVIIWVDSEGTIIKIAPGRDVEVRYVNIASVNGVTIDGASFAIGKIEEITLLDDETEYTVAENARMSYNGSLTQSMKPIVGKFARIVLKDEEIIFIESWDLVRGGIITDFNGANITYLKDGTKAVLRDVSEYDNVNVIIGKRAATLGEISPDTTFLYYAGEKSITIIASERKVIDKLYTASSSGVEIGEMFYKTKNPLFTEDLVTFTTDYTQLLSRNVAAYIGPDGYVWCVKSVSGESSVLEFYGIVSGIEMDNMDPEFGQMEVFKIQDQTVSKEIYDITDKTAFEDGLSLEVLNKNAKNTKGEGIYVFKVNGSKKITNVANVKPLYGFKTGVTSVSAFDQNNAFLTVDGKGLYFTGQPILGLYKDELGEFSAEFMNWSSIAGKSIAQGTMRFLSKDKNSTPSLIVLSGDLASMGSYNKYGVIADICETVSNSGETQKQVTVISMNGTNEYKMSLADAQDLKENMWITFKDNVAFNESDIIVSEKIDISGDISSWDILYGKDTDAGLHMGIAETADKNRIILKEVDNHEQDAEPIYDSAYYFHPSQNFFIVYNPDAPQTKFKAGTYADLDMDDTVIYNYRSDGIRGVIIVK